MPRAGELTYLEQIGESGREHAVNKPFSDPDCAGYLLQVGAVLSLMPSPPARVLDCGCGPGWLTYFLQKRGYDTVGIDVSDHAIKLAVAHPLFAEGASPEFKVGDADRMTFESEFDVVLFFDALHHCLDEQAAIDGAYRALKPGGVCICSEPGRGHNARARDVVATYDVTEKDMAPSYVVRLGRRAGFRRQTIHARADHLGRILYPGGPGMRPEPSRLFRLARTGPLKHLAVLALTLLGKRSYGITALRKS